MRYGVGYIGSKSAIAKQIISALPAADTFVDLFSGGCAISHAALLSGKYNKVICNDLDGRGVRLFIDSINGKYTKENRWVNSEDFKIYKKSDPYIALNYSFGNNMTDYLYAKETEEYKHGLHNAIFFHDLTILENLGFKVSDAPFKDIYNRYIHFKMSLRKYIKSGKLKNYRLESLERLLANNNLQQLKYKQKYIIPLTQDYRSVEIPEKSIIYCDIPYKNTLFEYPAIEYEPFYEWACSQKTPVFISEYSMPEDRFKQFTVFKKHQLSTQQGASKEVTEIIYQPKHQSFTSYGQINLF